MQAKRLLPHIKHKLLYANLFVYVLAAFLFVTYNSDVTWGYKTLTSFLFNKTLPPTAEIQLTQQAMDEVKNGNPQKGQQLLEKAVRIDPYSQAGLLLGASYLGQGSEDKALQAYKKYLSINPSSSEAYSEIIKILEKNNDVNSLDTLLSKGIDYFERRTKLYEPHLDTTVGQAYNQKALSIFNRSKKSLAFLKEKKKQLNKHE